MLAIRALASSQGDIGIENTIVGAAVKVSLILLILFYTTSVSFNNYGFLP